MANIRIVGAIVGFCFVSTIAVAGPGVPEKVATTCQACHGVGGDSTLGTVPRLNGQLSGYLLKRLHDFSKLASEDPHAIKAMWPVVSQVSDESFRVIADYYASQPPTKSQPHGPLAAEGRSLYANGVAAQQIPSCQSCHGSQGEGGGSAPRLAGQHAGYLTSQLERLRLLTRANESMFHNTRTMSDEQIRALAAYLSSE